METPQEMTLAQRHSKILQKIQSHNDSRESVELIAVSKKQKAEKVRELFQLGQKKFGENYAQELEEKAEALKDLPIEWIFIGHIQSNKIRKIVTYAHEIQTVSNFSHASAIARAAKELGKVPFPIMLEVNAGDETTKSGVSLDEIQALASRISKELPELHIRGLMAIPPDIYTDAAYTETPPLYRELRAFSHKLGEGKLSLGMSNDMRIALEAGSNFVRVGTAIFGARPEA